jgi:purine-nucleoside phosphorylase
MQTTMHDAIIEPRRGKNSPRLGPVAVLAATEQDLGLLRGVLGFGTDEGRRLYISRLYTSSPHHPDSCLAGPAVGAPYAVMIAETLFAWGSRTLIFFGWCGSLCKGVEIGDMVLPTSALIDEGTSRHYLLSTDSPASSAALLQQLAAACTAENIVFHQGPVWTTDAPFRETQDKVLDFQRQGALAVEMECSALFTVGAFRDAEVAALLVVSDDLSSLTWNPGFKDPRFARSRQAASKIISRLCTAQTAV